MNHSNGRHKRHASVALIVTAHILSVLFLLVLFFFFKNLSSPSSSSPILPIISFVAPSAEPTATAPVEEAVVEVPEEAMPTPDIPDPVATLDVVSPAPTDSEFESNLSPLSTPLPEPTPDEIQITDHSYHSSDISIDITTHVEGEGKHQVTWYEADIYVTDVHCLQTYINNGTFNASSNSIDSIAQQASAILCMNGDYAATVTGGYCIKNGVLYKNEFKAAQVCVLYEDGSVRCFDSTNFDAETELKNGAWQCWTFGPSLLTDSGKALETFPDNYSGIVGANPRSAFGYYEPGHYCFIVVDGRQPEYSYGVSMANLAKIMENLGCTAAYNLDGGKSSQMMFEGDLVNTPYDGGRFLNDILLIRELSNGEE